MKPCAIERSLTKAGLILCWVWGIGLALRALLLK